MEKPQQSENNSKLSDPIRLVRQHQKQGFRFLSDALKIDENQDLDNNGRKKAIPLYEDGATELELGIAVKLNGEGEEWERSRALQGKMGGNLAHARSRIDELSLLPDSTNLSAETKYHPKNIPTTSKAPTKPSTSKAKSSSTVPPKATTASSRVNGTRTTPVVNGTRTTPVVNGTRTTPVVNGTRTTPVVRKTTKPAPTSTRTSTTSRLGEPSSEQSRRISKLKNVDQKHANLILDEVIEKGKGVTFDDIGGMATAKTVLREIVILPALNPDLFTGLRAPARGLLLFGPPGNGKTLLAKAVSTESRCVFFNISAASLTSKFVGEGEKMVKAMFAVARELQPSIIFIDEIDSLLCERKDNEHEASRRIKTEFLLAFDGMISEMDERILVMAATNRPWELDDAALRRFVKRVYVPLPDIETRLEITRKLLSKQKKSSMSDRDLNTLAKNLEGYSGSDIAALARDAALMSIRELTSEQVQSMPADQVRGLTLLDFQAAMRTIRPSVSGQQLGRLEEWNSKYGCLS